MNLEFKKCMHDMTGIDLSPLANYEVFYVTAW